GSGYNRMIKCVSCDTREAERLCVVLGDWLCAYCCGQDRVVKVPCWRHCPFFIKKRENEGKKEAC
ncbi:MAG: hypothetical protein ACUZ8A_07595, partial [Candidatus Bathyanammoxibius sp.]